MIEVTHKTLQFQHGLLNHLRFKVKNLTDQPVTFKIRCNNNTKYKLDSYFGLVHPHQDFEVGVKNLEPADLQLSQDQFEIQYAQLEDIQVDLKEFWKNRKSLDFVIIAVEVIDVQQQHQEEIINDLQQRISTISQELQKIRQEYQKYQNAAVDIHYFNQFQDGFTVGQVMLAIALALFLGGLFH